MNTLSSSSSKPEDAGLTFDDLYARIVSCVALRNIWRAAFDLEYPDEAGVFSFVTRTDLTLFSQALSLGPTHRFVDLGCGCGGPALLIAKQTGATVVGVDTSAVAIAQAQALAGRRGFHSRATFQQSDATATMFTSHSFDGALCIDVLQMIPEPIAVLQEAARLLRPGSKVGLTTWCLSEPWCGRAVVPDYRPLLEASGFAVLTCDEPVGWKDRQLRVYELMREQRTELEADLGLQASSLLLDEAENAPEALSKSRRVRIVARLQAGA